MFHIDYLQLIIYTIICSLYTYTKQKKHITKVRKKNIELKFLNSLCPGCKEADVAPEVSACFLDPSQPLCALRWHCLLCLWRP